MSENAPYGLAVEPLVNNISPSYNIHVANQFVELSLAKKLECESLPLLIIELGLTLY